MFHLFKAKSIPRMLQDKKEEVTRELVLSQLKVLDNIHTVAWQEAQLELLESLLATHAPKISEPKGLSMDG